MGQAEYIVRFKGDYSALAKDMAKINAATTKLEDDEVIIKLNYDGNIKEFNKVFDQISKMHPELGIQFQYNVNEKMLNQEIDKLNQLTEIKLDVKEGNVQGKLETLADNIETSLKKGLSKEDISRQLREFFGYYNTSIKAGAKEIDLRAVNNRISKIFETQKNEIRELYDDIWFENDRKKIQLFSIDKSVDEDISATQTRVNDLKDTLVSLEKRGASKSGLPSELQKVQDEIKILRSNINEMQGQLKNLSGDAFKNLTAEVEGTKQKLLETIRTVDILNSKIHGDIPGPVNQNRKVAIFDGYKEQIYDIYDDAEALDKKLDEMAEKMNNPAWHGGDLRHKSVNSSEFRHADSFQFALDRSGNTSGTGEYSTFNFEDVLDWIMSRSSETKKMGLFTLDLGDYNMLEMPSDDYYEGLTSLYGAMHRLVSNELGLKEYDLNGLDSPENIFIKYEQYFKDFNISLEDFIKFLGDEKIYLSSLDPSLGLDEIETVSNRFMERFVGNDGLGALNTLMDDSVSRGSVVYPKAFNKEHPYAINWGGNYELARKFFDKVKMRQLETKAANPQNDPEEIVENLRPTEMEYKEYIESQEELIEYLKTIQKNDVTIQSLNREILNNRNNTKNKNNTHKELHEDIGTEKVEQAAQDTTQKAADALQKAQDSNSPAELTKPLGKDFGAGYAEGIRESLPDIVEACKDIVMGAYNALKETSDAKNGEGNNFLDIFINNLKESLDNAAPTIQEKINEVFSKINIDNKSEKSSLSSIGSEDFQSQFQNAINETGEYIIKVYGELIDDFKSRLQNSIDETGIYHVDIDGWLYDTFHDGLQRDIDGQERYIIEVNGKLVETFKDIIQEAIDGLGAFPIEVKPYIRKGSEIEEVDLPGGNKTNLSSESVTTPSQQFDNEVQQNLVMLENYKNTVAEIDRLKLEPETDETKAKLEELNKLADYFASKITVIRSENGGEVNTSMMLGWGASGGWSERLKSDYSEEQRKEFLSVAKERTGLQISSVTSEFHGISDEIANIEAKSEGLRNALVKDLVESSAYVSKLRAAYLGIAEANDELKTAKPDSEDFKDYTDQLNTFLSKYPELEKFKDVLGYYDKAPEFVKSDEWLDFLATLPQAHTYLESIGYDFDRINQASNKNNLSSEGTTTPSAVDKIAQAEDRMGNEAQEATNQVKQGLSEIRDEAEATEEVIKRFQQRFNGISREDIIRNMNENFGGLYGVTDELIDEQVADMSRGYEGGVHDLIEEWKNVYRTRENLDEEAQQEQAEHLLYLKQKISEYGTQWVEELSRVATIEKELFKKGVNLTDNKPHNLQESINQIPQKEGTTRLIHWTDKESANKILRENFDYSKYTDITNTVDILGEVHRAAQIVEADLDSLHQKGWDKGAAVIIDVPTDMVEELTRAHEIFDKNSFIPNEYIQGIIDTNEYVCQLNESENQLVDTQQKASQQSNKTPVSTESTNAETKALLSKKEVVEQLRAELNLTKKAAEDLFDQQGYAKTNNKYQIEQTAVDELIASLKEKKQIEESQNPSTTSPAINAMQSEVEAVNQAIESEKKKFDELKNKISKTIPNAIAKKNKAFKEEAGLVSKLVGGEAKEFDNLKNSVDSVTDKVKESQKVPKDTKSKTKTSSNTSDEVDKDALLQKHYTDLRRDAFQSIGQKSQIQQDMSEYYAQLEKDSAKAYSDAEKKANSLLDKVKKLQSSNKYTQDFKNDLNTAETELRTFLGDLTSGTISFDQLDGKVKELSDNIEGTLARKAFGSVKQAAEKSLTNVGLKIDQIIAKNSAMGKEFESRFKTLKNRLNGATSVEEVQKIIAEVNRLESELISTGNTGKSFIDQIKQRLRDINSKYIAQYFSFQDIIRYARQAATNVIQLNDAFIELSKVSNTSLETLESDFQSYADIAHDIGGTITDTINATADWARMGYSVPDSKQLAEVAMLYKNVGDGISIDDANSSLISTLQGYQMQADEAEHIVDVFNEVYS